MWWSRWTFWTKSISYFWSTLPDNHYHYYHYYCKNDNQKVATRPADNPMGMMARKVGWNNGVAHSAPRLSLPGKFVCCFFLLLLFLLVIIVFVIFYSHCRQIGVPLLSHSWTLLDARSRRCGDARTSSLLCHALWCVQKSTGHCHGDHLLIVMPIRGHRWWSSVVFIVRDPFKNVLAEFVR